MGGRVGSRLGLGGARRDAPLSSIAPPAAGITVSLAAPAVTETIERTWKRSNEPNAWLMAALSAGEASAG